MDRCRLYMITPPAFDVGPFAARFEDALEGGDVACVQLRLKDCSDDAVAAATQALMPIAHAHGAAFLINDRPDLAAALDADGAHVGQTDIGYDEARALLGDDKSLGITCHNSRDLAMAAGEAGADYVAFGAFFPTATKETKTRADTDLLEWWSELFVIPCVAIGGIRLDNCAGLVEAGADFLAVSSAIWQHELGPRDAVKQFNRIFDAAMETSS